MGIEAWEFIATSKYAAQGDNLEDIVAAVGATLESGASIQRSERLVMCNDDACSIDERAAKRRRLYDRQLA